MNGDPPDTRRGSARRRSRLPAVSVLAAVVLVIGVMALTAPAPETDRAATTRAAIGSGLSLAVSPPITLTDPLPADAARVHVPILMYHYVDDTPPPAGPYADGLTVRTNDFVAEMDYLIENSYQTVSLADVYLAMAGDKALPERPVVLTFDDGGLDNYEVAFPILRERGLTATFFVITGAVGREGSMSWEDLREMAAEGMSIQSHSVSHPDLRGVSSSKLRSELVDSRRAIAEAIGEPSYVISYPSGAYDAGVIEAAKAAGYVMAVATDKGKEGDPAGVYEMKRRRVQALLPLETFAKLVE